MRWQSAFMVALAGILTGLFVLGVLISTVVQHVGGH